MKLHIQIGPLSLSWGATESSEPQVFDDSAEARSKRTAERERDWKVQQATRSASGGQFGFGRTDLTAIEHSANRWETGGRVR